jgi:hypothetical protein
MAMINELVVWPWVRNRSSKSSKASMAGTGTYIFAGGLDEDVDPVMVTGDGMVTAGTYPQTKEFTGGFTVVDVPSREAALEWAAKIATACRCAQEVREFMFDPLV